MRTATQLSFLQAALMLLAALANHSFAAAAVAQADAADTGNLQEIVVTASKRETKLLQTPLAITALTQAALDEKGIETVRDLKNSVPNLQLGTGPDSGTAISLRGVVSTDFTEVAESAVALHLDGFYTPRSQSALALMYDVERVEVLRGPQGTLFGMNSPGGAINIIPVQPVFNDYSSKAEAAFGNYNERQVRVAVNLGVGDTFAVRVSGMFESHDGYIQQVQDFTDLAYPPSGIFKEGIPDVDQRRNKLVSPANWYNNAFQGGLRAIARWQATEALEVTGTVSHFFDRGAGDIDFVDCEQAAGTINACDHPLRFARVNVPGKKNLVIDDVQLKIIGNLSEGAAVEYRGGIQNETRSQISDLDGGAHPVTQWSSIGEPATPEAALTQYYPIWDESTNTYSSRYFSTTQELQLKSRGSSSFQYVAGAFLLYEKKRIRYDDEILANKTFSSDPSNPFLLDGLPNTFVYDQKKRTTNSKALFGQVDWRVLPKLGLTAGYRYSWDEKGDFGGVTYGYVGSYADQIGWYNGRYTPPPGAIRAHQSNNLTFDMGSGVPLGTALPADGPPTNQRQKWSNGTFRVGAQYYASDDHMLFVSAASGYKMGGFYETFDVCNNGCVQLLRYDPETVKSYELGYKGKLFDNHLQLSVTAFFTHYDNMQQTGEEVVGVDQRPGSPTFGRPVSTYTTVNLAGSEIKGLEIEFNSTPWAHGTLSGFASWLDAKVTKSGAFIDAYARPERAIYGQTPFDASGTTTLLGKHLPYAPNFSVNLNYRHGIDLPNGMELSPFISGRFQTKMWLDILNYAGPHLAQFQKAYFKLDASLRLSAGRERYFFELYGENLTGADTKSFDNEAYGRVRAYYDPPLTWGVRFGTSF